VVTSFVVESSKNLQPDPNVQLLFHIAARLDNEFNNTTAPILFPQIQLYPSPSSYRINALWFSSLVLSLTTVLAGIVSLQWLREHQQYSGLTPQEMFSIFHLRKESLKKWYVPQIFAGLPLLLQAALVLYLAGLVDHLLGFGSRVAIPGIVFITLTLLFLVTTTILPALQGLIVVPTHLEVTTDLPSPCAYKSPQSQAFRRVITMSGGGFRAMSWVADRFIWVIIRFQQHLHHVVRLETRKPQFVATDHNFPSPLPTWRKVVWTEFDRAWLELHDYLFANIWDGYVPNEHFRPDTPLYDAVNGIKAAARGNESKRSEPYMFAQYQCLQDISSTIVGSDVSRLSPQFYKNQLFRTILTSNHAEDLYKPLPFLDDFLRGSKFHFKFELLFDENTLAILNVIDPRHRLSQSLSTHFKEVNFRLMAYLYSEPREMMRDSSVEKAPETIISIRSLNAAFHNTKQGSSSDPGEPITNTSRFRPKGDLRFFFGSLRSAMGTFRALVLRGHHQSRRYSA